MLVTTEFTFDSAHFLPNYHGKCESMHGHTYRLQVTVDGPVNKDGLVIDFALLKQLVNKHVLGRLDHNIINNTIKIASAENTIIWIWNQLVDLSEFSDKIRLHKIKLWETPNSFVTYHGK